MRATESVVAAAQRQAACFWPSESVSTAQHCLRAAGGLLCGLVLSAAVERQV